MSLHHVREKYASFILAINVQFISLEHTGQTTVTYCCLFFDFSYCTCTYVFSLENRKFFSGDPTRHCYICDGKKLNHEPTSSTAPVGSFHIPVPRNMPHFSWTTSTWERKLQLYFEKTTFRDPHSINCTVFFSNERSNNHFTPTVASELRL